MACYSHSRLSTFGQCRYKYKLQYIDKIKVEIPSTIECFMGGVVHKVLEKLYRNLGHASPLSLKELLLHYNKEWDTNYSPDILIVKDHSAETYKDLGRRFIIDYYNRYQPFDDMGIIGLETQDMMDLPDKNKWHIRIDKLGFSDGAYFVCDYKTNNSMKTQKEADSDRQLAMYAAWVKDKFKARRVVLKWHMLAFNAEVESVRSDQQLSLLIDETCSQIKLVESCREFPMNVTKLCSYCVFQKICPSFKPVCQLQGPSQVDRATMDKPSGLALGKNEINAKKAEVQSRLFDFGKC